jgi:hypothetical protein
MLLIFGWVLSHHLSINVDLRSNMGAWYLGPSEVYIYDQDDKTRRLIQRSFNIGPFEIIYWNDPIANSLPVDINQ